jgi:hypothetical protein
LYYGSVAVDRLILGSTYGGYHFILAPDGNNGTDLMVAQGHGGGGGGGGQGTTDVMAWAQPGTSGAWDKTANWYDVTTGSPALAPPGSENPVEMIGAQGSFQVIGGPGLCATLSCFGDTMLSASFTTGTLEVGGTLNGTATAAILDVGPSSGATATVASADGGTLLVNGTGTCLSVTGTLTLGGVNDALLATSNHGTALLGGLALAGLGDSAVTADVTSSIEIGQSGGSALGAVTVDAGYAITGYGAVNPDAAVVDNGSITAQGGMLEVGGVSGTGVLNISCVATLLLSAGEAVPIDFTGGGGTLELAGSAETPAGIIAGFAPGDLIVTGSSQISAAAYAPGPGGVGTLILYSGTSIAGTLLLEGNFAGDSFTIQPDGMGSAIAVQAGSGGPSPGTPTPDQYVWTGAAGTLWNTAANWSDITAGQPVAAIAPGSHDLVTIAGAAGSQFTTIIGPADAALLAETGNLALSGQYSIGALDVGSGTAAGVLALGADAALQDASATVLGAVLVQGGAFSTSSTLSLLSSLLQAGGLAYVQAGAAALTGTSALTTDGTATVEIGQAGSAARGAVTVDAGAVLSGAGAVNPQGLIVDNGTITASGGTLVLGAVSGTGVVDIGVNATLDLSSTAGAGVLVDFAGPGALMLPATMPLSAIADFGAGDQIFVPVSGITDAVYAATGAGIGVLTLSANGQTLGQLTLEGVGLGQTFAVAGTAGGTILTTQTTNWGGGGSNMRNQKPTDGSGASGIVSDFSWWAALPGEVQTQLIAFQSAAGNNCYVWTSPTGSGWGDPLPGYANFAVAADPAAGSWINLPAGYEALLAQGTNGVILTDGGQGGSMVVGNAGNDTLIAGGDNDTLVGGSGNTVFFAADAGLAGTNIYGGGNDTIVTDNKPAQIHTSAGHHSIVFLGNAANYATLNGNDTVIASGQIPNDTVQATGSDVVFGPNHGGQLTHIGGAGYDVLIANSGTFRAIGGTGTTLFFTGASALAEYLGGAGPACVICDTGPVSVLGGAGAITVYGGSGLTHITGAPGPSQFVLGTGSATVNAASGNDVWLASAANDSLVASSGNVLLWAASATGNNVFQAGNGPVTMHGGLGSDTFLGGLGNATMTGGGGADVFSFTNGLSGGTDLITDFSPAHDVIDLHGYGSYSANVVNGSEVITLSDGTHIQLAGIASMSGVHVTLG